MTTPVSVIKSDDIWFKNIYILVRPDRLTEFFPNKMQTVDERMNSVARLGIYASLLMVIYKRDWKYLFGILAVFVVTYVIYKNYKKEGFSLGKSPQGIMKKKKEVKPTVNNPFMNTMMTDYVENPNKEAASEYYQDTKEAETVRKSVEDNFNYNLYQSLDDVYDKNNSQRQFYTTPNTKIPSDQDKYLKFLYGDMNSCKTDGGNCALPVDSLRRNPHIFPDQKQNPTVSGEALNNIK